MVLRKLLLRTFLVSGLMFGPAVWTNIGLGQNRVTPDESVYAMLPESLISLQLHEADLKSILRALGKEYKLNLLVHEAVSGLITLGLEDIALRDALQAIARTRGLTLVAGPGGTIEILPLETYQSRVEKVVAATRQTPPVESPPPSPLITQKIDIQYAFNPRESISAVGRDIGLSGKQVKDLDELAALLEKRLSGRPGSEITMISRLNALVVTDTPEKVEEIMRIVSTIDVPSLTVGIEARIVEITSQALEDLGIQWGGLARFGDATFTGGGLGARTGEPTDIPQSGNVGLSGSNFIVNLPATIPIGGPGSSLGFTLGKAATKVLDIQLSALEQDGKLKLLAAPRLTTMNHERAWIESGTEIPFRNQSVSGGGVTTFTVEFKSASIELEVTPHVVGDGESQAVFLDVVVTRKEADFARAIDGNPPLLSRTIYTRALVKTGETVVIGGLMREDTTETVEKVPWASDLPFLGWLFSRTQERDEKSQLMIFITPSVLPTPLTKSGVIKTAKPLITSKQTTGIQTTGQQDEEAKRKEQSAKRQEEKGQQTTGQQTTGQQTTDQGQRTTEISKTVGSRQLPAGPQSEKSTTDYGLQTTGQQDEEAKRKAQSAKRQEEKGQQTTEIRKTVGSRQLPAGQQSEKSTTDYGLQTTGQEAKRKAQSAKRQEEKGQRTTEIRKTVGSRQPSAKSERQSDKRTTDYGLQTTGQEAKRKAQSEKQQQEVAPRADALPADRIW